MPIVRIFAYFSHIPFTPTVEGANVDKLLTSFSIFDSYDEDVILKITKKATESNTLEK